MLIDEDKSQVSELKRNIAAFEAENFDLKAQMETQKEKFDTVLAGIKFISIYFKF